MRYDRMRVVWRYGADNDRRFGKPGGTSSGSTELERSEGDGDLHPLFINMGCVYLCNSIPGSFSAGWTLLASSSQVPEQAALCPCQLLQEITVHIRCFTMI
ncbi:hypothetical protein OIU74_024747 [Salix koriyanagi]|uniref:Uncharacterized protein n=1 Tax=Salix koriyanagi TaxID=2511006 RepID=A0A9Q0W8T6_9ROSI|nr:hypothetical protein OIU74_024747 [Salix koriyanagi]